MLKVFIAHDLKDSRDAQDLARRLSEGGAQTRLGQTAQEAWQLGDDAAEIIIVWSNNSLTSPYLYEIAAIFRDSRLLHVKIGNLESSRITETIRPRELIPITDHCLLEKLAVRRKLRENNAQVMYALRGTVPMTVPNYSEAELEALERESALEAAASNARRDALGIEAGKLVHKFPDTMTVNVEEILEVRLGHVEMHGLISNLQGRGKMAEESLPIVETMTVSLSAGHGTFDIVPLSRPIQLVNSERIKGCGYDEFGKWIWRVIPKRRGTQVLNLMVSANLLDGRGVPASASLPPRTFSIRVRVNIRQVSRNLATVGATGIAGAFFAGIIGAYTQDIWWPTVKHWMQSIGLLS